MHPSSVRRLRRGHSPSEAACHPRKKRLYLTDRQATGGAAISALTTSLWGRGFSRLAAGRIPSPRWGQKQRLPALVAYHTPHSLSRLNFAKCPFAHHSTLTQQNMIHFVAFARYKKEVASATSEHTPPAEGLSPSAATKYLFCCVWVTLPDSHAKNTKIA